MQARYAGTCTATGKRYPAGTEIEKGPYGWQIAGSKPADRTVHPGEILVAKGEGYGGQPYSEGQIFRHEDTRYWVVRVARSEYYREDGLSFGVGDDSGHIYYAVCRLATTEEYMPVWEKEQAAFEYRSRGLDLDAARKRLFDWQDGEWVSGDHSLTGEWIEIGKGFNIYGGGEEICVCEDGIWYCENNGMDGDNWSMNNVRTGGAGAIGRCFPKTKERLAWIADYKAWRAEGETE